jgi:hypothetical protein
MLTRRLTRLTTFVLGLKSAPTASLLSVIGEKRYPVLMREAALRWLVWCAPIAVTKGAPFAARRRSVRQYYGI